VPRQPELSRKRVHVAAGILFDAHGRVLIADRSRASTMQEYWEFPGGKRAGGESAAAALRRELVEELGVEIRSFEHFRNLQHDYSDLRVAIDFYFVTSWAGTPSGREGQRLQWLKPSELSSGILLPADAPLVPLLQKL